MEDNKSIVKMQNPLLQHWTNTAEFRVYDDNKKLVSNNQWNLVTGFKASIIVTKE